MISPIKKQSSGQSFGSFIDYSKIAYNVYLQYIFLGLFAILISLQIFFGQKFYSHRSKDQIVSPAPTQLFAKIVSFGDEQFLFRLMATKVQNTGDIFAGFVPLNQYDYSRVYGWLKILDFLDSKSSFAPSVASYYFANSQNNLDKHHIVNYLEEHAKFDPANSWWWLFQAVDISLRIPDNERAIKIAEKISQGSFNNAPLWVKLVATKLKMQHQKIDSNCLSFVIINNLLQQESTKNYKINNTEVDFMKGYIKSSVEKFKKQGFDPRKCQ
jgi:hypothetical protein